MESEMIKKLEERRMTLDGRMSLWRQQWQSVVDYLMPWKADVTMVQSAGAVKTLKMYDSTPTRAQGVLTAGMMGYLTSLTSLWFKLQTRTPELMEYIEVKEWLEEVERVLLRVFNQSNFAQSIHEFYEDLTGFGTGALFIQSHHKDIVRFFSFPIKDILIAENADGDIDTVFRTWSYSHREAAQEFGKEALDQDTQKTLDEKPDSPISITHVTLPRDDFAHGSRLTEDMPYASLYYPTEKKNILLEGGHNSWPWAIARWKKSSREVYGRGPGIDNMADIKTLHQMERSNLRVGQKRGEPPLDVPYEYKGRVKSFPNAINYYKDERKRVFPWVVGDPAFTMEMTNQRREAIKQGFFVDLFLLLQRAEEIKQLKVGVAMEMVQERLMILGPIIGRLHVEGLGPLIERSFSVCMDAQVFPPPPQALVDQMVDIVYISPLAKAQAAAEARSTMEALEWLMPFIEWDQSVVDRIKTEEAVTKAWEIFGAPSELLRTDEEFEELQEAKAEAMEQQQMMAQAAEGAAIDKDMAQAESLRGEDMANVE